jgi:hypothetical protein
MPQGLRWCLLALSTLCGSIFAMLIFGFGASVLLSKLGLGFATIFVFPLSFLAAIVLAVKIGRKFGLAQGGRWWPVAS